MRAVIATHAVYSYGDIQFWDALEMGINLISPERRGDLISFCFDDLSAPVITRRADVVTQMYFASAGIYRQRRTGQRIMRTVHAALGWGFLILLDCHGIQLLKYIFNAGFSVPLVQQKEVFPLPCPYYPA